MKALTVTEAEEILRKARQAEHDKKFAAETELKAKEAARIAAADVAFRLAENAKLAAMVGLEVSSVNYDTAGEGTISFTFTNGTVFSVSASGDDATCITYGFEKNTPVAKKAVVVNVQFYVPSWEDPARFARDLRICEGIYGRTVSDLEVERAYARYKKLAVQE